MTNKEKDKKIFRLKSSLFFPIKHTRTYTHTGTHTLAHLCPCHRTHTTEEAAEEDAREADEDREREVEREKARHDHTNGVCLGEGERGRMREDDGGVR